MGQWLIATPRARRDVDEAVSALNLPGDTWTRIARSLRALETFPLAGLSQSHPQLSQSDDLLGLALG